MECVASDSAISAETLNKMKYGPLTNLGCESEMARLDNRIQVSGGNAPVETLQKCRIIEKNDLFSQDSWKDLSSEEEKSFFPK